MRLEWIVLGSGCFSPEPGERGSGVRNPSGYALKAGRELLLFDLGFGNLRQLFRAGLDPSAVTHAFFTHRHPDHVGDLPALLFGYNYAARPRSRLLRVFGPRGFSGFCRRLERAHHPWLRPRGFRLEVAELEEGAVVRGKGWRVAAREVPHSTEALAFRFQAGSRGVCYSGDTGFDPGLAGFARSADLFVLECTLPDGRRSDHHLRVSQAVELFRASGAARGVFSHLSGKSLRELGRLLRPPAERTAEDLMRLRIA